MAKLVVEVLDASDLGPKDGKGSANPYVEVEFDKQLQRTRTKLRELDHQWNEKLVFNVISPTQLPKATIEVVVYNDKRGDGQQRDFLGRVRISGDSVPWSESHAFVQRYPLEKRGLFSPFRGELALRIYVTQGFSDTFMANGAAFEDAESPLQGVNTNNLEGDQDLSDKQKKRKKKKKKKEEEEKELKTFYSIGNAAGGPANAAPMASGFAFQTDQNEKAPPNVQTRADFARASAAPATMMHMQMPRQNPQFGLVETRPPVPARMRYRLWDRTASTCDLVEQMHYLYVSVVKAKDLPVMDVSGSLDPYVEVKLGNYRGVTKHLEKNQNPVWKQIFAFSKERIQSNFLEITVKDKDVGKDDFVGRVVFDTHEVPHRVPPDSPLAPQWYKLETKKGEKGKGEIMLAVWMGTQADESFPEAWHSDAHNVSHVNLSNTRSKVYFSPNLYYLRVHVIGAQDLVPSDKGRMLDTYVKVQLANQLRVTRPSQMKTIHPVWNDELMFVTSEPFEDYIIVSVNERVGPGKEETLGRLMMPVRSVPRRIDTAKLPPGWFNLLPPSKAEDQEKKKEVKFSSKICIQFCLDSGYHVLDESTHFSSDFQPSSKNLRKKSIGFLELGIRSARNLPPMKGKDGRATDAYCVAKYGNKWARTRTLIDTLAPRWNEKYTWEVFDPCTVITVGVFDNCHINGKDEVKDQRIGKVRIRLSTLETDRTYIDCYPLLVLQPSGLMKRGELEVALRFTCTAWIKMVTQYGKPLLPKMHYAQPIPVKHIDLLRHQAMQIVAARLLRAEPPLRREVVEYMLDVDYHMFSLRRSKANFYRIMSLLSGITAVCRWYNQICYWRNPVTTCLVHVLFLILVCYPELILPTIFLYLFVLGLWNYRFRPRHPPFMDPRLSQAEFTHPDELDEEFDTFPTTKPADIVRMRYDRLRSVAGRVQTVVGDLATQGERALALLSWRDPRATAVVITFALILAIVLYVTPFQVVGVLVGLYSLRHPRFRSKLPSVPVNFFKRLPSKSDMLL